MFDRDRLRLAPPVREPVVLERMLDEDDVEALLRAIRLAKSGPAEVWHGRELICRAPSSEALLEYRRQRAARVITVSVI